MGRLNTPYNEHDKTYRLHGGRIWENARATGIDPKNILDFSANINPLGPSPKAISAIKRNLWKIPHYPETDSKTLRDKIAERLNTTSDTVLVGNGSTEIIHLFAESYLTENGKAIIPQPTFAEYEAATRRFGAQPRLLLAQNNTLSLPLDKIEAEIERNAQAIFLCNPNNPTGELIEKKRIMRIVEKSEERNIPVLIDETFIEFSEKEEDSTLIHLAPNLHNLVVLRSFTKMYALTGLRIGYAVGQKSIVNTILEKKAPWNTNCLAEVAARASLDDRDHIRKTKETVQREKDYLQKQLSETPGLAPFPSQTNFILVSTEETRKTSQEIQASLLKKGMLIRDCSSFRGLGDFYIRTAVRLREQNERLIKALSETIK